VFPYLTNENYKNMLFHRRGEAERQADKGDGVTKKEKWRKKNFFLSCL